VGLIKLSRLGCGGGPVVDLIMLLRLRFGGQGGDPAPPAPYSN
jgi:hypothetical protein